MGEVSKHLSAEFAVTDTRERQALRLSPAPPGGWTPRIPDPVPRGAPHVRRQGSPAPSIVTRSPPPRLEEPVRHEPELVVARRLEAEQSMREEMARLCRMLDGRKRLSAEGYALLKEVAAADANPHQLQARGGLQALLKRLRQFVGARAEGQWGRGNRPGIGAAGEHRRMAGGRVRVGIRAGCEWRAPAPSHK
jgi:hypothetical protein